MIIVGEADAGKRLDNFVQLHARQAPRDLVYKSIRSGQVRVDGKRAKPSARLAIGQAVRLPPAFSVARPRRDPLPELVQRAVQAIIHNDHQLLVLAKPPGMAVHAGSKYPFGAVELLRHWAGCEDGRFPELVHRLDRLTSGCLVLAHNPHALQVLQHCWRNRQVRKTYLALVHGHIAEQTEVDLPLLVTQQPGQKRVIVDYTGGKDAHSLLIPLCHARLEQTPVTLLACQPHTGRMHQLRVHCQSLGHPVVGDPLYQNRYQHQWSKRLLGECLLLHARRLEFRLDEMDYSLVAPGHDRLLEGLIGQHWLPKSEGFMQGSTGYQ